MCFHNKTFDLDLFVYLAIPLTAYGPMAAAAAAAAVVRGMDIEKALFFLIIAMLNVKLRGPTTGICLGDLVHNNRQWKSQET